MVSQLWKEMLLQTCEEGEILLKRAGWVPLIRYNNTMITGNFLYYLLWARK